MIHEVAAAPAAAPAPEPAPDAGPSPQRGDASTSLPAFTAHALEPIEESSMRSEGSSNRSSSASSRASSTGGTATVAAQPAAAPSYRPGDLVSVYSRSMERWVDGVVLETAPLPEGVTEPLEGDIPIGYTEDEPWKWIDPADAKPRSADPTEQPATQTEEDEEPAAPKKPKASLASRIQALEMRCVETKESVVFQNGGKYKKLGLFGKGGSCKVFKVLDEKGEIQALKRVKEQSFLLGDDTHLEPFINEIELLRKLNNPQVCNPNIIKLHDAAGNPPANLK